MKRKLKTIRQLLEEFPDAYIGAMGVACRQWHNSINQRMLENFGKEINPDEEEFHYDEQWFEQPKVKKLYVYDDIEKITLEKGERQ